LINANWEDELYKYITGILRNNGHKMLQINGMSDHVHILFGLQPSQSIAEIIQIIKGSSSKWINERGFVTGKFKWQSGYGAFSYSKSQIPAVAHYIETQKEHHKKYTFYDEYITILEAFGVKYDKQFVLKEPFV